MKKDAIIFITKSTNNGGLENYLLRYLQASNKNAHRIVVSFHKGSLHNDYIETGIELIYLRNVKGIFDLLMIIISNTNILSLVDFRGDRGGISMALAKLLRIKKRIAFYRNSHKLKHYGFASYALKLGKYANLTCSTSICSNTLSSLQYHFETKYFKYNSLQNLKIISNGINTKKYNKKFDKKTSRSVFVVGNFRSVKNHELIFKVLVYLSNAGYGITIEFFGRNIQHEFLRYKADNKCNFKEHTIKFHENVNDMSAHFQRCFLFLLPSFSEGQSNALIEAMVSSCVCLCSKIPSNRETIHKSMISCLIEVNDINKWGELILNVLKHKYIPYSTTEVAKWASSKYDILKSRDDLEQLLF